MGKGVVEIAKAITYEDKIFQMLIDLKNDIPFDIVENVRPENRGRFIQTVKSFITSHYPREGNYTVDFNSNMTKLRKFENA